MNTETQVREDRTKDPATLEREINQTRAEMNQTLDSLERKLTAGQLLDQCLTFFGMKGTEIGSSLGRCIKDNPMPVLLTATGIGWMMFGPNQNRSVVRYNHYAYDDAEEGAEGMMAKMSEQCSRVPQLHANSSPKPRRQQKKRLTGQRIR